ncbi:TTC27-like protein [Mya arenaria]|uniref:TTC27-like protein n=1 Tax=Mya arenaria TaxID=6604 RepID=A0ABY7G452_MYAAR|nr:TTC27-like protein [Mya arenaria]
MQKEDGQLTGGCYGAPVYTNRFWTTSALGKRTRFQQTDNAQLLLQVTRLPVEGDGCQDKELVASSNNLMPKALNLDDDTVLEAINFTDPDGQEVFVLNKMENWSVAIAALLLRSKLEKGSRRRVERSMRQLEELFNQTMRQEPSAGQRSRLFYAAKIPPVWEIQRQLAELLLSLGAVGSALEIYEQLELWEDAIACYQRLGKTEKAETVIREQLAVHETPNLWCFLGDITRNIEHYEKAWVLSKHRSARAQRCMGYLYFAKEEVGTDCGEFSAVIRAYHRLMDLRDRWVDEQVLGVLVRGVRENIADASGVRLSQVEQSLRELFGRITSKVTDNAEIWRLYAELCINDTEKQHHTDPVTKEIPSEDIRVVCSQLEDKMAVVVERLDTLKQGS